MPTCHALFPNSTHWFVITVLCIHNSQILLQSWRHKSLPCGDSPWSKLLSSLLSWRFQYQSDSQIYALNCSTQNIKWIVKYDAYSFFFGCVCLLGGWWGVFCVHRASVSSNIMWCSFFTNIFLSAKMILPGCTSRWTKGLGRMVRTRVLTGT